MSQTVKNFIQKITETHASGHATEHSYRPALQELFEKITELKVHNEPKRSEYGAPDFVFIKGKTIIAYAEAKDVSVSLNDIEKGEQMGRYYGYSNIILTNGLDFRFYRNGTPYMNPVVIGELKKGSISINESSLQLLEDTIKDFIQESKEPIKSGSVLAKVMAGKARRIRDNIKVFLAQEDNAKNESLLSVYEVIKKLLLADLDKEKFADMYAQTLVYGLFVARYYDPSPENFSRQEARDLVPASNPFLRHFFDHIAGSSFDPRIEFIVSELCEEFTNADVQAIVHNYYKVGKDDSRDPIIHFYEDFLQEYDSAERKKMGVFYTPLPVVRFIVRAVDDILKKEFNLPQGLADNSKIEMTREVQGKKHKTLVHKVQVLDPATGTGTFLNEAIHHIQKSFVGQEGRWNNYVNEDLLPRLHGFELMMASYTIAHLKLSSTIKESGATISDSTRLGVYLTNSLEKGEIEEKSLFSSMGLGKAITEESNQASRVKNELPIMVVMGNPPYSGVSSNETENANSLVEKYKTEPGGKQKLQERKHWLNDDYVKFIAFAEGMIAKNGEGVVGFITNHGYLDNPTFRGMRWHLMDTFDSIYVVDLHGNAKKKEVSPDGSKDENVFAIQQGVSIVLAVKTGKKKKGGLAKVYRSDVWGKQKNKFEQLDSHSVENMKWTALDPHAQNYLFTEEQSREIEHEYDNGFKIDQLFIEGTSGVQTSRDRLVIDFEKDSLIKRLSDFFDQNKSNDQIRTKFFSDRSSDKYLSGDSRQWKLEDARSNNNLASSFVENIKEYSYRPFDSVYILYDKAMIDWHRFQVMKNMLGGENISLTIGRQGQATGNSTAWDLVYVQKTISDLNLFYRGGGVVFPLYLYAEDGSKIPNLKKEIVDDIETIVGKTTPENILDYIYAALYSPNYREKYKEFLKIDFPRVPYPQNVESFKALVALGGELRALHLLESPKLKNFVTTFPASGSDTVEAKYPKYKDGNVYINETQYFGNVPEVAWIFYIGGYQPAKKWLKDRQSRKLTNTDIEHYQKIIVALVETDRIMKEVDNLESLKSKI